MMMRARLVEMLGSTGIPSPKSAVCCRRSMLSLSPVNHMAVWQSVCTPIYLLFIQLGARRLWPVYIDRK